MSLFTAMNEVRLPECEDCGKGLPLLSSRTRCQDCEERETERLITAWSEPSEAERERRADMRAAAAGGGWDWEQ